MSTWQGPYQFKDLLKIMATLRSPNGCPWDKEQTHQSLLPYLREESAELQDAIINQDWPNMREELGDVLLQVVFHSQLADESELFTIDDVIDELCTKLVTRHPHVFGQEAANTAAEVEKRWEEIKKNEKAKKTNLQNDQPKSILDGIPQSLGALDTADKIGKRCKKVGFEWSSPREVLAKVREELAEVEEVIYRGPSTELKEELGDVFFTLAQLSRQLGYSSEEVVLDANKKFKRRFVAMELMKSELNELSPSDWEDLWIRAKAVTKESP